MVGRRDRRHGDEGDVRHGSRCFVFAKFNSNNHMARDHQAKACASLSFSYVVAGNDAPIVRDD